MTEDNGINIEKAYTAVSSSATLATIKADQSDLCININMMDEWYTIADTKLIIKVLNMAIREKESL